MSNLCGCEPEHSYYCATCFSALTTENEKLKRIVEVLEKSNKVYASPDRWSHSKGSDPEFILWGEEERGYEIARQAKAEVERIRKGATNEQKS